MLLNTMLKRSGSFFNDRILGNREILRKSQNFIELLRSSQSSFKNEDFVSTSKNILKNRN